MGIYLYCLCFIIFESRKFVIANNTLQIIGEKEKEREREREREREITV